MKGLLPPGICGQAKSRYARANMTGVVQLLLEREELDQRRGSCERVWSNVSKKMVIDTVEDVVPNELSQTSLVLRGPDEQSGNPLPSS